MAAPILKNPAAAVARTRMRQVFYKAEQDIIDEINRKRLAGYVDYAEVAALERVQQILTDMQDKVGDYMPKYIEKIFYNATEKDAHGYANARSLTSTQLNIEQQLVNNLMGTLIEAEAVAFESAKRAFLVGQTEENIFREATLHHLLEGEAMGRSWRITSKNMAIDLQKSGITAFTDKAGREWSLTDYCDMATRTTARQAEVAAALTADDWDLWQIAAIGSTCKLCATYEGRVYSKSGTNPDYPPLWEAFGKIDPSGGNDLANTYLNIHPNCLHSLVKYTTMGKTEAQIQRDKDFSSFEKRPANADYRTKKQREAYRTKERNRAKLLADRNQWQRYREAFGDEIPDFESFRRNKVDGTAKYQKWESEYRSFRDKAAAEVANLEKRGIIEAQAKAREDLTSASARIPDKYVRAEVINEAIQAKQPIYAEDLREAYTKHGIKHKEDCYDVVLHGTPHYAIYEGQYRIDDETLSYIISGRKDWNASDVRLISCSTGKVDKYGNCFAKELAKRLKVNVYAPIDDVYMCNGKLLVGDDLISEKDGFRWFTP